MMRIKFIHSIALAILLCLESSGANLPSSDNLRIKPALSIVDALSLAQRHHEEHEDIGIGRFIDKMNFVEHNQSQPEERPLLGCHICAIHSRRWKAGF